MNRSSSPAPAVDDRPSVDSGGQSWAGVAMRRVLAPAIVPFHPPSGWLNALSVAVQVKKIWQL